MSTDFNTIHPRNDTDGRFTEKDQVDAGVTVIGPMAAGVEKLQTLCGPGRFTVQQYERALDETGGDLTKAQVWLRREQDVDAAYSEVEKYREAMVHAREHAAQASVRACVQRLLQFYGDEVTGIVLSDNGEGDVMWEVVTDDAPEGFFLDDEVSDDVHEMSAVSLQHPLDIVSCCTGYHRDESGIRGADGLYVDRHTGRLIRAEIDLTKFTV